MTDQPLSSGDRPSGSSDQRVVAGTIARAIWLADGSDSWMIAESVLQALQEAGWVVVSDAVEKASGDPLEGDCGPRGEEPKSDRPSFGVRPWKELTAAGKIWEEMTANEKLDRRIAEGRIAEGRDPPRR